MQGPNLSLLLLFGFALAALAIPTTAHGLRALERRVVSSGLPAWTRFPVAYASIAAVAALIAAASMIVEPSQISAAERLALAKNFLDIVEWQYGVLYLGLVVWFFCAIACLLASVVYDDHPQNDRSWHVAQTPIVAVVLLVLNFACFRLYLYAESEDTRSGALGIWSIYLLVLAIFAMSLFPDSNRLRKAALVVGRASNAALPACCLLTFSVLVFFAMNYFVVRQLRAIFCIVE